MLNKNSIRKQILFSGIAFGIIALLFGMWSHHRAHPQQTKELMLKSGTALSTPRQIAPFELKNALDGTSFSNTQLKGHWSMLFFGFTHCAMLCPTTLSNLNQFYTGLAANNVGQLPQIYFVSIDPERDSLERINSYVTSFNKSFKGATGTEEQLDHITKELNILFAKVKPDNNGPSDGNDEDYQIDHSGTVLVINPDGNLAALFSPPLDPKAMVEDYEAIIQQAR